MRVLVTGGIGYIGSHTVVELINRNYEVIIVDNLSNSSIEVLDHIKTLTGVKPIFYECDVLNKTEMDKIFKKHQVDAVIHFAGYKAVGESVEKPLMYYENNVISTIVLAELTQKYEVNHFVFSSSATVYGDQPSPLNERSELKETTNPYGESKRISERILKDFSRNHNNKSIVSLRYFNPIGAHESGLIGEKPNGIPNNLMPFITQVASGKREKLLIFGDDYNTIDGTGVRDYIHVVDLALGHIAAIENVEKGYHVYNLGSGEGISVLKLVQSFIEENNIPIPYEVVDRRAGDLASVYADPTKALNELGWKVKFDVIDMVKSSWNFEKKTNIIK